MLEDFKTNSINRGLRNRRNWRFHIKDRKTLFITDYRTLIIMKLSHLIFLKRKLPPKQTYVRRRL